MSQPNKDSFLLMTDFYQIQKFGADVLGVLAH